MFATIDENWYNKKGSFMRGRVYLPRGSSVGGRRIRGSSAVEPPTVNRLVAARQAPEKDVQGPQPEALDDKG